MKWHKLVYPTVAGAVLLGSAMVLPAIAQNPPQDNIPGSFLVFPIFDIRSGSQTTIRITDTSGGNISGPGPSGSSSVGIHIDYVCKGTKSDTRCNEMDDHKTLTFHETLDIEVNQELQVPGCDQGYIVVFAEDPISGDPVSYNNLIGSYHIGSSEDNASYGGNAIAFQANAAFLAHIGVFGTPPDGDLQLTFGTTTAQDYVALPRYLHSTFKAEDPTTSSTTELVLLTLNVISGVSNTETDVTILYWNEDEFMKSIPHRLWCWDRVDLDSLDGHFDATNLPGDVGSLKVVHSGLNAVLGVVIERGAGAGGTGGKVARNTFHVGAHPSVTTFHPE